MPMLALFGIAAAAGLAWPGAAEDAAAALGARDDAQRLRAVLELARADDRHATAALVPALRDRDPNVRITAGRLLAHRGSPEALTAATAWLGEAAPRERLLGLLVLREADALPDDARRAVERTLRNGDVTTRLQALELLARRPSSPSSVGAIIALLDDELAEVRVKALRALAAAGDARASLAVVHRLSDGDRGVRMEAATTLGALGDRRVVPALLRQLDDATSDPRTAAVDALGRLGDPAAIAPLARLARRAPRDDLARHATAALAAFGGAEAVEALLAVAREPGADDVVVALARGGAAAVPRLGREVTAAGSPPSAPLAARALGLIGDRRATAALVSAVERATSARVAALEALGRLGDPTALPALARVATEGEAPELRARALEALEATGDARAGIALPRALEDPSPFVRARAARLAGTLGDASFGAALAARVGLGEPDLEVRREAARALARSPAPDLTRPEATVEARVVVEALAAAPAATFDAETGAALGDALERVVTARDGAALARAYLAARADEARAALARGLAASLAGAQLTEGTLIDALVRDLGVGGALALGAAEALASARPPRAAQTALLAAHARAEDVVRARLGAALARFPAGAEVLARDLADATAAPSVRAASAWALAGVPGAREALREAVSSAEPAVAANARAALAVADGARPRPRWAAVRLAGAAGEPAADRWVAVTAGDGVAVWALTDELGRARVAGLPDGALALRLAPER